MIIKPNADDNTGNCLPVSSCLYLAHLLIIKHEIKASIIAIKT